MNKFKKVVIVVATTATLIGCTTTLKTNTDTKASTFPANSFVDKITKVYKNQFDTKYGWTTNKIKSKPVHVGDTVELMLNTNGHSPNIEDWYTDNYIVIKHK